MSLPFLKFYFYLFLVEGEKKGVLETVSENKEEMLFIFKALPEKQLGITNMWNFFNYFSDEHRLSFLIKSLVIIHKGFSA